LFGVSASWVGRRRSARRRAARRRAARRRATALRTAFGGAGCGRA